MMQKISMYNLMDQEMIDDTTWQRVCECKVCYIAMQDDISSQSSLYKSKLSNKLDNFYS